jgi:hypothetical protein
MTLPRLIADLRKRPLMFLRKNDYSSNAMFILGADVALNGRLLNGFRAWLDETHPVATNMAWFNRVLYVAFPGISTPWDLLDQGDFDANHKAIETLFSCLETFFTVQQQKSGTMDCTEVDDRPPADGESNPSAR